MQLSTISHSLWPMPCWYQHERNYFVTTQIFSNLLTKGFSCCTVGTARDRSLWNERVVLLIFSQPQQWPLVDVYWTEPYRLVSCKVLFSQHSPEAVSDIVLNAPILAESYFVGIVHGVCIWVSRRCGDRGANRPLKYGVPCVEVLMCIKECWDEES